MAYVSDFLTRAITATTALTLPPHEADDIIVVAVSADGGGTLSFTWGGASTGGAQVGTTQVSGVALSAAVSTAKATGTAATCTVTMGTADSAQVHMFILKDCDPTTWLDVSDATVAATASTVTVASVSTTTDDCLLLYYLAMDQNTAAVPTMAHSRPGPGATMHFIDSSDNGGTTITTQAAGAAGWYFQRTAGATPQPVWDLSITEIHASFVMAFRNKSGGKIPAYVDDYAENGTQLMTGSWWASAVTRNNQNFKATPLTYANIGPNGAGQATTFDAGAIVGDAGINPYSGAVNSTPASSTTNAIGFECGFPTTAHDMTTGWIVGVFHASTKKMAAFHQGSIAQGGTFLVIGAGANYRSYRVMARNNADGNGTDFSIISVQPNQTQTRFGYSAAAPTITAIDKMLILHKGQNTTGAFYYTDFHLFKKLILTGGDATYPVDSVGIADIAKFCRVPVVKKLGAAELTAYVPIQVGGGDAINFQVDAGALQFPRIASETAKEINYHGADGAIGISYAGKSGDTIKHTNSVVTSVSPYYWEINAAATSAATWDFTGLVVVKANVTLRDVMTFAGMAFSNCGSITATACTMTDCEISGVPATSASFIATSGAFSYLTVNVTTLTAGNHWWTGADPTLFSYCTFIGSGSAGHALRITTPGTYALVGNEFDGFGANGTNFAAIFNDSGGAVVLNISGGGTIPTVRNGAGATTTVVQAVTVKVTVKDVNTGAVIPNARVLMEAAAGGDLGVGVDILSGLSNGSGIVQDTAFSYTNPQPVVGKVRRGSSGYGSLYKTSPISGTITSTGIDLTVFLIPDE